MKIINYLFIFVFATLLIGSISALDNAGSTRVNDPYKFCQACSDATFVTLSSIQTPTQTLVLNANMTVSGPGLFCYTYSPTEIGRYNFIGVSDGCERTFATYIDVTPSGQADTLGFTFVIILIAICLIGLGFWIKDGWFVVFGGMGLMGFGIYSVINGIAGFQDDLVTYLFSATFIGVGAYLAINSALEMINDGED